MKTPVVVFCGIQRNAESDLNLVTRHNASDNALTIGALNDDGAGDVPLTGYQFDPADGELIISPISALGSGHHRSVKPDIVAPGGRARFMRPVTGNATEIPPAKQAALGPGVKVAAAKGGEAFTVGTSPAAAMVSRIAARAVDTVVDLAGQALTRSELAVATKAMVAHTAKIPDDLRQIFIEEGAKSELEALRLMAIQNEVGTEKNIRAGLEMVLFSPEMVAASDATLTSHVIPNWLRRLGGPDHPAVQLFNDKVAPWIGLKINPDGSTSEIPITKK